MKNFTAVIAFLLMLGSTMPVSAASILLKVEQEQVAAGSIPRGAQRVEMLRVSLAASCGEDVVISGMNISHAGLGDSADIVRVYAMERGRRISRTASFSSANRIAILRLPSVAVEKCATRTIGIFADFSSEAASGAQHYLRIALPEDIVTSHPGTTQVAEAVRPALVTTTPSTPGTVEVEYLPVHGPVRYGAGRTVARIRLTGREKNQEIHSLLLTNDGSARESDLQNLYIEASNGDRLTDKQSSLDGSTVLFTFDPPLKLDRSETKVIELIADIRASRRRTIDFIIEEPSDLKATERKTRR